MVEDVLPENEIERMWALQGFAYGGQGLEQNVSSSAMYCMRLPSNEGGRYITEASAVLSRMWCRDPRQRVQRRAMF